MACPVSCTGQTSPSSSIAEQVFGYALADLGAPNPGAHNLSNLMTWYPYEGVGGYNPLGIEGGDTGCGYWNSHCVSCFCSASAGGAAYAALWRRSYPAIVSALMGDLPLDQWGCLSGLVAELNVWGTGSTSPLTYAFAVHVQSIATCSSGSSSSSSRPPYSSPLPPPPETAAGGDPLTAGLLLVLGGAGLLGGLWLNRHPGGRSPRHG